MNRRLLLVSLLTFAAAVRAQSFGPEIALSAPRYGLSRITRSVTAASNGTDFLLVWTTIHGGLFASRVTADGNLLEPLGIPLAGEMRVGEVFVASAGGDYLVTWWNKRSYARIVRSDGSLGPLWSPGECGEGPIASTGSYYLLPVGCGSNQGRLLDQEGNLVKELLLDESVGWPSGIAADPSGFLFLRREWIRTDSTVVLHPVARKIDLDGRSTQRVVIGAAGETLPVAASNRSEYLLAWRTGEGMRAARLAIDGTLIEENLSLSNRPTHMFSLASNGDEFVILILEGGGPLTLRSLVLRNGKIVQETALASFARIPRSFTVASVGSRHMIATVEQITPAQGRWSSEAPVGRMFERATMSIERTFPAGFSSNLQSASAASSDGENLLVLWEEFDPAREQTSLLARIVTPHGETLNAQAINLSDFPDPQRTPSVAFDGRNYLVVWQENENIVGRRISAGADLLDPPLTIAFGGQTPHLAFDGTNFLVAWVSSGGIAAARVTPAGNVLDQVPILIDEDPYHAAPRVGWSGSRFVVVWRGFRFCYRCVSDFFAGSTVDPHTGTVTPFPTLLNPHTYPPFNYPAQPGPSIGCNDRICLVAWSRYGSLRTIVLPPIARPGRQRPVATDIRGYDDQVSAKGEDWARISIVPDHSGFMMLADRLAGPPVGIRFDASGEKIEQFQFDLEQGGTLYRAGPRLAYVYSRITADSIHGGAKRIFVRFSPPAHSVP